MTEEKQYSITVFTIGHGNRGCDEFVAQLRAADVECLVDVRAYPASKRHPQFTRLALEPILRGAGIRYLWEGQALGGMRAARQNSPHVTLTDPVLRGYADHMATAEFRDGIARVIAGAREANMALMCAEREPLHCHRSFIADALLLRGVRVLHLYDPGDVRQHGLRPEARPLADGEVIYDAGVQLGLML